MESGERPKVFISYARVDRARVARLADALTATGHEVWWDALIDGGSAFAKAIETQLESADAIIVAWSATSVDSDWVRDEAGRGRDRRRLVPVSVDGTLAPLGFRQYHTIDLGRWNGRADAAEFQSVERGIATVRSAPLPVHAAAKAPVVSRRSAMLAGGGVAVAAVAAGLVVLKPWQATSAGNGVAVLPFKNLSGDPGQAYFSDGLAEEIRAALTRNAALKVAAPTSTNEFRDRGDDVRAIARSLGVAYVLEGSVRKAGDVVRIVSSLIDAGSGFTSWSLTFDRNLTDIFAVQSEIAAKVERALADKVTPRPVSTGGTASVAAYEAYLQGRALFNADEGEASDRAALAKFDAAIAADPKYAAAYAARSRSLAGLASIYGKGNDLREQYDAAANSARKAVALAPNSAAAHAALGFVTFNGLLDARAAREPYARAAELGRGDADILVLVAFYASKTGRHDDALRAIHRAQSLDPLNARTYRAEGSILNAARRHAAAIAPARKALSMKPKLSNAHAIIGTAYYALGDVAAARAAFMAEPAAAIGLGGIAICANRARDKAGGQAALAKLVADYGDGAAYQQAQVFAQMPAVEPAIEALLRARASSDGGLTGIMGDVMLDPVRRDPRFVRLLTELGFT